MAKKRRHRIWWMALHTEAYEKLRKTEVIPADTILFDKQNFAYGHGYSNRFEVIRDADNNIVTKSEYAQLRDRGRIKLVGVTGDIIDWRDKRLVLEKVEDGNAECVSIPRDLAMPVGFVQTILEESDEAYLKHLQSPIARAGGIVAPEELKQLVTAKENLAHAMEANKPLSEGL